jgi:hypothetical protein
MATQLPEIGIIHMRNELKIRGHGGRNEYPFAGILTIWTS